MVIVLGSCPDGIWLYYLVQTEWPAEQRKPQDGVKDAEGNSGNKLRSQLFTLLVKVQVLELVLPASRDPEKQTEERCWKSLKGDGEEQSDRDAGHLSSKML